MDFNRMLKMLIFLILIANTLDICQGKAFSEAEKVRGKRYYNHDQSVGLHQTYDSQSNAEHWVKGKFYQPEVDGQPIYIPPADLQGSYNEFLDSYYKQYTPAWSLATPGPPEYDTKSVYKSTKESVVKKADKGNVKYSTPKGTRLTVEMSPSEDYDSPEIVDKTTGIELNNENSVDESEENQSTVEMSQSEDYSDSEYQDYDEPAIVDKTIETELSNKKSDLETSELKYVEVKKPNLPESLKKIELPQAKPKDYNQYDQPIIKAVKQNQKGNTKESVQKETSVYKTDSPLNTEGYEEPVVYKTVKQKQKENVKESAQKETSVYKTNSPLNTKDYEEPVVYKVVKSKPKSSTTPSALKYSDQISTSQATRKKAKGKRRNKYSKQSKPKTNDNIDFQSIFDPKTIVETYEQSKNDDLYTPQDTSTKVKEKVVVKTDQKNKPVKTKVKVKTESKNKPVKTKEKIIVKSNSVSKPVNAQYRPSTSKEKVIIKPDLNDKPLKEKPTVKYDTKELEKNALRQLNDKTDSVLSDMSTDNTFEDKPDLVDSFDTTENELNSDAPTGMENNSEISKNEALKQKDSILPGLDDFRKFSSMNSNIWSMLFNPNAEQNRLKLKRCITRSNETGFCTYIQNCDVPHIATSLEQLLNNACVIDDIFIGVCCPEFPVQTVKVHWDQTASDFDNQVEDEFGNNVEDCGVKSNEASKLQSWPWKAPLVSMSNGKIFCGGVVVSQDHVLTAAHCTTKIPKNQILVRLGQYDDDSGDDYAVVEIKRHAQYNPRTMHNDVALLKLGRRIINDAHIGTVCLPDEDGKNNHDGETATLLGWRGIFGTKSRDPEFLQVMSNKECENKLGMKVPSTLLCTETRKENERTCNADSGAPLVIEEDGKYEVIGILSWNRNDCNQRFPSTFSRVSSYTGWIKNHIA